ncbi:PIN domain-containing protein [Streptomyces malaysiensis]|uniref:PIN domain-containing protein n=1 Tax=Streptomyces malaysiensis TaxID=92644 RepID=UPI0033ECDF97
MIYLLDTNVVAELTTRPKPDPHVIAWFHSTPSPNLYLSVVTVAEIEAGVAATSDPLRQARYRQALTTLRSEYRHRIAAIGEPEATAYLTLHKTLKTTGQPIDPPDALIAATALANRWTLASRNTKHLTRTGVELVNPWHYQG